MKEGERISLLIETLYEKEQWARVQKLVKKELKNNPNDTWYLGILSSTYYEQKKYIKALAIIKKAIRLTPEEPLLMWHYAGTLYGLGKAKNAINIYKKILKKSIRQIAFIDTTEGISWAKSLINDCRYRIGLCYRDLGKREIALRWIKLHLKKRN